MNRSLIFLLLSLLAIFLSCQVSCHPTSSFDLQVTTPDGTSGYTILNNATEPGTIYFVLRDDLNKGAIVTLGNLILYHERYIHIQMISSDKQWVLHTHPDFYMDLSSAPLSTSVFRFNTTLPISGYYSIAATFLFSDSNGNIREGVCQTDYYVGGSPGAIVPPLPNYSKGNLFTTYAVNDTDIFDDWVHVSTNDNVTNGYYVELIVGQGSADVNSSLHVGNMTNMNSVLEKICTWMYITVYADDGSGAMVNMLPYLASPAHLTVSYQDGALYHGHATYVPQGMNFLQIVSAMNGLSMTQIMSMNPKTNMMYNLSMNAEMIGVQTNGTFNCLSDEGQVMMAMGNMMDMSVYYGPNTFNTVASIFNFNDGRGQWDIFAYMKFKLPSGEERLIVPHFQVLVLDNPNAYAATTGVSVDPVMTGDDSQSSMSSTSGSSRILASILALVLVAFVF